MDLSLYTSESQLDRSNVENASSAEKKKKTPKRKAEDDDDSDEDFSPLSKVAKISQSQVRDLNVCMKGQALKMIFLK